MAKRLRSPQRKLEHLSRVFTLGNVDSDSACEIIGLLYEVNREDRNKGEENREPIQLLLNSCGGSVYDGMAIVDAIEQSITPVHVYVLGQAQSMAFAIATCGAYRYATKRATFMYHEIAWSTAQEKMGYHEQELKEGKRLWQTYDDIITTNTNIPLKTLQQVRKEKKEWYLTAQQAKEYGIIDEVL